MKIKLKVLAYFLGIVIALILLSILNVQKSQIQYTMDQLDYKLNLNDNYMKSKSEVEGKFVWEIGLIPKRTFFDSCYNINYNNYRVYFWYDSIGCPKCYNFHRNNLLSSIGNKNITIINNEYEFIKRDFPHVRILHIEVLSCKYKQLVVLVNNNGRVIYADFPQYQLIANRGPEFYKIVSRYFNDS